jgi:hypothetical protein
MVLNLKRAHCKNVRHSVSRFEIKRNADPMDCYQPIIASNRSKLLVEFILSNLNMLIISALHGKLENRVVINQQKLILYCLEFPNGKILFIK